MIKSKFDEALSRLQEQNKKPKVTSYSAKDRKNKNLIAKNLLEELMINNREPTEDEKKILIEWSGKGGLGNSTEYFTPDEVAQSSWKLLNAKEGDIILDPSTGNGVFSRTAPKGINIKGCDLNGVSANIANLTNKNSNIEVSSFEEYQAKILDNSLDGVITNVPFGRREKPYNLLSEKQIKLHEDYFIIQSLKKLKPGKRGVFLTTSSQSQRKGSDRQNNRNLIQRYGSFIGGYRLPSPTFEHTGTTQVVDILVFEKHPISAEGITFLSWSEMIENSKRNHDFLKGTYFDNNPDKILGDFISQEDMQQQAKESGDKLHHQLQRDTVTLRGGETLEDVYKRIGQGELGKNDLDYSHLELRVGGKPKITKGLVVTETAKKKNKILLDSIDAIRRGELSELPQPNELKNTYQSFGTEIGQILTQDEQQAVEAFILLDDKGYSTLREIVFTRPLEDATELIKDNENMIKKFMREIRTFRHSPFILDTIQKLTSFDFNDGKFINIFDFNKDKIELDETKKQNGFYPKSLFTEQEIIDNEMIVLGDKVQSKEDFLLANNNQLLSDTIIKVLDSDTPDKVKESLVEQLDSDYSSRNSVKTFNFPMKKLQEIVGRTLTDLHMKKLAKNKGLEAQALSNATKNIKQLNEIYTQRNVTESLKSLTMNALIYFFIDKDVHKFNPFEKGSIKHIQLHIKKGYLDIKPIVQELTNRFINENFEARDKVTKWLEEQRVIKFDKSFSEDNMNELSSVIKQKWLDGARHYQNSDSRKLAQTMEGALIWGTGVGKTKGAIMTAMQMHHQGTAKRVMYVVLNSTIGKMGSEVKDTVTDSQMKKTLVVSGSNIEDLNNIKDYNFIIISHSALINQIKLKQESIRLIWGAMEDEDSSKYPNNNVQQWLKTPPDYSKKALYNFEDLGIDALIIDELHTFKNATASLRNIKGLNTKSSNEALRVLFFSEYIKGIVRKDMKGVIGATATPLSNSPSEMLTTLLFTTDRVGLKHSGIHSLKGFENRFYNIGSDLVMKTNGSWELKNVLLGVDNIDQLHNIGYDKMIFRNAEEEQARAAEKGITIKVKPPKIVTEVMPILANKDREFFDSLSSIQQELSKREREERTGNNNITIDSMIYREWTTFGFIGKAKMLAISKPSALGYTQILIPDFKKADKYLKAIEKIKIKVKHGTISRGRLGQELKVKMKPIAIGDYEDTEYYTLRSELAHGSLLETIEDNEDGTGFLNVPTTDYAELTRVINALKKVKLYKDGDELFKLSSFPKYEALMNNILRKVQENPRAKQVIYSTSIHTHAIIEKMIKSEFGANIKIWIFNPTHAKKDEDRLRIQNEFNAHKEFGVMIFGESGATGVDFNIYVNAAHLMDIGNTPTEREQAEGRAVRQGNVLDVEVFKYATKGTFDNFLEVLVENKANWIESVNTKDRKAMFNDDSMDEISAKAEQEFGHLDISVEEKIQKYIDKIAAESREKQAQIDLALVQSRLEKLKENAEQYKKIDDHDLYYMAAERAGYNEHIELQHDKIINVEQGDYPTQLPTIILNLTDTLIFNNRPENNFDFKKALIAIFKRVQSKENFLNAYGNSRFDYFMEAKKQYISLLKSYNLSSKATVEEVAKKIMEVHLAEADSKIAQAKSMIANREEIEDEAVAELRKSISGMENLTNKEVIEMASSLKRYKTIILNNKYHLFVWKGSTNVFYAKKGTSTLIVQGDFDIDKYEYYPHSGGITLKFDHGYANFYDFDNLWELTTLEDIRKKGDTDSQLVDHFIQKKNKEIESIARLIREKKIYIQTEKRVESIKQEFFELREEAGEQQPTEFKQLVLARREYKERVKRGYYDSDNS